MESIDNVNMADQQHPTTNEATADPDAHRRPTTVQKGRYMSRGEDRHPPIYTSQILLFPSTRPGRMIRRKTRHSGKCYFGDAIIYKAKVLPELCFRTLKD
ncbi:hypothetical protein MHU86_15158 [Fragilaria crotonensis]|nr:hypothetical protein MHU86_15158 [Fragilaria crotonensis]